MKNMITVLATTVLLLPLMANAATKPAAARTVTVTCHHIDESSKVVSGCPAGIQVVGSAGSGQSGMLSANGIVNLSVGSAVGDYADIQIPANMVVFLTVQLNKGKPASQYVTVTYDALIPSGHIAMTDCKPICSGDHDFGMDTGNMVSDSNNIKHMHVVLAQ